jgi:hypothetical protein
VASSRRREVPASFFYGLLSSANTGAVWRYFSLSLDLLLLAGIGHRACFLSIRNLDFQNLSTQWKQTIMSYSTKMWAVTTVLLLAILMFASTKVPALQHRTQAHATAAIEQRLLPEQNLHNDPSTRFKRTIAAFGPMLALLFVTLVVLDSIERDGVMHRLSATENRSPELMVQPRVATSFDNWPRKFDLVAGVQGWTAVRYEPDLSPYGGN